MSGPVSGSERDCLSWNFWRAGEAKPAPAAEGGPPYVALRCVAAGRGQLLCCVFGRCKRLLAGSAVEVEGQFSTACGLGERCVSTQPLYILLVWIYLTKFLSYRKSTFFNVLTKSQAAAENFPFCTIDPNESRVPVPDDRFDFLCQYHKPPR